MLHQIGSSDKNIKIPPSLLCPVTLQIFKYPVTLVPSGIVVEQQAADNIIADIPEKRVCPKSRKPIKKYISAFAVIGMIDDFLSVYPDAKKHQYIPVEPFKKLLERDVSDPFLSLPVAREYKAAPVSSQTHHEATSLADFALFREDRPQFEEKKQQPNASIRHSLSANSFSTFSQPTITQPIRNIPLPTAEKEAIRNDLLKDVQNLIWALKFESGPKPQGKIDNFSLLFFAMIESAFLEPLPWQKIKVAAGPRDDSMYQVLKAAKNALNQLDPSILENSKTRYANQYDKVQPVFGEAQSLSNSNYASFAKVVGTVKNQPGTLVSKILKKVESQLPTLCAEEREVLRNN